jgi:hypothetical protein
MAEREPRGQAFAALLEGVLRDRLGPHRLSVEHDAERGVWDYRIEQVVGARRYGYRRLVFEADWAALAMGEAEWHGFAQLMAHGWATAFEIGRQRHEGQRWSG